MPDGRTATFPFQTGSIRLWDEYLRVDIRTRLSRFHSKLVRLDFETLFGVLMVVVGTAGLFPFQTGWIRLWDAITYVSLLEYMCESFHSKLVRLDFETYNYIMKVVIFLCFHSKLVRLDFETKKRDDHRSRGDRWFPFQTGSIRLWDTLVLRYKPNPTEGCFHSKLVRLDFETHFQVLIPVRTRLLFPFQTGSIRLWDSPLYGVSGGVPPYP